MKSCLPGDRRKIHPVLRQLNTKPVITQISGLMLPEEADYIVELANAEGFGASETDGDDGEGVVDESRTSSTAYLPENDAVLRCLRHRMATLAQMPEENLDELQATAYERGQYFRPHYDDPGLGAKVLKTIFAYLRDEGLADGCCGGATAFPKIRKDGQILRVYPRKGSGLMWSIFKQNGSHDHRTLHSGEPVTCPGSKKIGLNAFFLDSPRGRQRRGRSARRPTSRRAHSARHTRASRARR